MLPPTEHFVDYSADTLAQPELQRRAKGIELVQAILGEDAAIDLRARDIALLVLIRQRIVASDDHAIALSEGEIRGLAIRLDDLDVRDPSSAEKRITESLSRLMRGECLVRSDFNRLKRSDDAELHLTSLGENIADWHLERGKFTGEPLAAILRVFTSQLATLAEDAEKSLSQDYWETNVLLPMKHVIKDMLANVQRHQKALDRQHDELRAFIPRLLTENSEESIGLCEEQLARVSRTIRDLHEVTLASTTAAGALLGRIENAGEVGGITGVQLTCAEIARRLQAISNWTNQRLGDWSEHNRVVHDFLRSVVRIDRMRRLTDALKRSVAEAPTWTLSLSVAPPFLQLQEPAADAAPRRAPRRKRRDYDREVMEAPVDHMRERLDALLIDAIAGGEAKMSVLLAATLSGDGSLAMAARHAPWLVLRMANAGKVDNAQRDWVPIARHGEVQELRIETK